MKDVHTKSQKIPPMSEKCPHLTQPPSPPCLCGHTINFEKPEIFCTKKCERPHLNPLPPCPQNVRTGQPGPLLTADIFYRQPLIQILPDSVWILKPLNFIPRPVRVLLVMWSLQICVIIFHCVCTTNRCSTNAFCRVCFFILFVQTVLQNLSSFFNFFVCTSCKLPCL